MKTYSWLTILLICCLGAGAAEAADPAPKSKGKKAASHPKSPSHDSAAKKTTPKRAPSTTPLEAGPAEVSQEKVNVRSQPVADSEVVAHLKSKDSVKVLEEVAAKKTGPGEPARWAKIAWPEGASVWVFADFLDRTASTVKVAKLNLRAGPSENHSVVGVMEKGAAVKKLEAKGDWWKIEAPSTCVAYVAANLLVQKPVADKVAVIPPSATSPGPLTAGTPRRPLARPVAPPPAPLPLTVTDISPTPPPAPIAIPRPAPPTTFTPPAPIAVSAPVRVKPAPAPEPTSPPVVLTREPGSIDVRPIAEAAFVKRVVTREGRVRRAWSIQAPTPLILENLHNGKVMNYLYSTSTNLNLGSYRGKVVIVSGEEALDERWPHIPVIRIDSLQTPP